jgi:carboxyl-terminal processing protease
MNDVQRNFLTAGIVCAASGALIGGMAMRERADNRAAGLLASDSLDGLVASRSGTTDIGEERYFYDLMVLLKREYVDPIPSETPLAVGSVKGMISSLDDEHSLFMSKKLFQAFENSVEGHYEGIGANLVLRRLPSQAKKPYQTTLDLLDQIPVVRVTYVVPGGPAAKAGLKAGDEIESIDARWIVSPEISHRYRKTKALIAKKQAPEGDLVKVQSELRERFKNSMMPMRAFERLSTGTSGVVKLAWRRNGQVIQGALTKAETTVTLNTPDRNGLIRPAFVTGASEKLGKAIESGKPLSLDLRGMEQGNLNEVRECLALLAPAGEFGRIAKDNGSSEPLRTTKGKGTSKPIKLLVDHSTSGAAEAFALALKSRGRASIEGGPMAGDPSIIERAALPDGSGFTLRVGTFKPGVRS